MHPTWSMRIVIARVPSSRSVALVALVVAGVLGACRQGDPGIEPKTPPNSPLPTKLDRPDDPKTAPTFPKGSPDAGT
jgi:hypothetical protein